MPCWTARNAMAPSATGSSWSEAVREQSLGTKLELAIAFGEV
jgi:hypothetical protein